MRKIMLSLAVITAMSVMAADVDWKWDTSGHVETPPATASIAISTMLPDTAKQASDEGCLNIFSFLWLDSNPFKLSGSPLGIFIVIR